MSDKPILFSGLMVRALLAGTKTQTRRRLDAWTDDPVATIDGGAIVAFDENERQYRWPRTHSVGDRLYVREHWRTVPLFDDMAPRDLLPGQSLYFEADGARSTDLLDQDPAVGRFRQGMHMPRWASRLTLTVTDVRVERVQGISWNDAIAEGVDQIDEPDGDFNGSWSMYGEEPEGGGAWSSPIWSYRSLWRLINGPGSWEANPWVAAYTFTVELGNIDRLRAA